MSDAKRYAKKRESIRAVRWMGEMTPDVAELVGQRKAAIDNNCLVLTSGWQARVGDWIMSASGEDLSVIGDAVFRVVYEEVDDRTATPTGDEHEAAAQIFIRDLDAVLGAGLKLSREEHPSIFRDRDLIQRQLRRLLEDHAWIAARREQTRIREKIAKELLHP